MEAMVGGRRSKTMRCLHDWLESARLSGHRVMFDAVCWQNSEKICICSVCFDPERHEYEMGDCRQGKLSVE